ncbi:MAG: phosphotransferase [Planctomycetes bacterium]|nr:phosphotransferase [Planctomycetota bacterium]
MLNPHDKKIIAIDSKLPGLRAVLDDEVALALFAEHVPDLQPTLARCTYLRYKPHTSCLAAFTVETNETQQTFHLVAYRSDAADKLAKAGRSNPKHDARCPTPIVVPELAIVLLQFPCDHELPTLQRVSTPDGRIQLLSRLTPEDDHGLSSAEWTTLRYKPGRRYVARLDLSDQPRAVLKLHSAQGYAQSRRAAKSLGSLAGINTARPLGHSDHLQAILLEWLRGESLAGLIAKNRLPREAMCEVGSLLARLHAQHATKLPHQTLDRETQELLRGTNDLSTILPSITSLLNEVSQTCAEQLSRRTQVAVPIHGDCHPQQIVVDNRHISMIDLDSAAIGHSANDLGNFLAHLQRDVLQGKLHASRAEELTEELLRGYAKKTPAFDHQAVQTYLAIGLLRLAHEPFRYRLQNWPDKTEKLVQQASQILDHASTLLSTPADTRVLNRAAPTPQVADPFLVSEDSDLSTASEAINPQYARQHILPVIKQSFHDESLELRSIRVLRHKPGRRCLIEYACENVKTGRDVTVLGKIHAKRRHTRSHRLQQTLWESGFDYESADGISVARPAGIVPECRMWLQERVPGTVCWDVLAGPRGEMISARIADAAHKLHQTEIVTERVHTIDDELRILEEKLPLVAQLLPRLNSRINAVLEACRKLVTSIPSTKPTGIHRDFYPDQILVDRERLFLLDHDLYCQGDPCLDIGNFCGHLIEQSLREHGVPDHYADCQHVLVERFCSLQGKCNPEVVNSYTTLTVARHIYLSTRIAGRGSSTHSILNYCEEALSRLMA